MARRETAFSYEQIELEWARRWNCEPTRSRRVRRRFTRDQIRFLFVKLFGPDAENAAEIIAEEYQKAKARGGASTHAVLTFEDVQAFEIHVLKDALTRAQGVQRYAARLLGISERQFNVRVKKFGLTTRWRTVGAGRPRRAEEP